MPVKGGGRTQEGLLRNEGRLLAGTSIFFRVSFTSGKQKKRFMRGCPDDWDLHLILSIELVRPERKNGLKNGLGSGMCK